MLPERNHQESYIEQSKDVTVAYQADRNDQDLDMNGDIQFHWRISQQNHPNQPILP
jgi:hypothetical protein